LEFIRAKYFGRELGVPELLWYTNVETPLDSKMEGLYPFEEEENWDGNEAEILKSVGSLTLEGSPLSKVKKTRRVVARRISVSSSESDVDIKEVLKEVVRDYTATHTRSTRPAERSAETCGNINERKPGKDLILLD
jgi:hypothetical protein